MRVIFFIILSAAIHSVAAVPTDKCPRVLEMSLQSFDLSYPETILPEAPQDMRQAVLRTREKFERMARLKVKYTLKFAGGEKCYYEGHNQTGQYYRATIEKNSAPSSTAPYQLINKQSTMATKIAITSVERGGLTIDENKPMATLYHYQKNCTGSCQGDFIPVGSGSLRRLR